MSKYSWIILAIGLTSVFGSRADSEKPTIAVLDFQNRKEKHFSNQDYDLPESAGKIAADEFSSALGASGVFRVVTRNKFEFSQMEEEKKFVLLRKDIDSYVKLCKDLGAQYLVTGKIDGFHVDEKSGEAYGVKICRVTTRIVLDIKVIDVSTGEIVYQASPSNVSTFPLPEGVTLTEILDWKKSLRSAIRDAAKEMIKELSASIGINTERPQPTAKVTLNINSTPPGADILVDDLFLGNTPASVPVSLGSHKISIEYTGYRAWERNMKVYDGMSINPVLEKNKAPSQ